ncbi:hypothetical protein [Pseudaquabacterium terrae]|uniref:hypothetical protein n=1 Tax=Pseudaquabacterium terrae TaxID=2732868 RepID=UPI001562F188|nr:hypothetical protein [Aquabacterium terrae]
MHVDRLALRGIQWRRLGRQPAFELEDRQVHRQRGAKRAAQHVGIPSEPLARQAHRDRRVHAVRHAGMRTAGGLVPHDLEDREVRVTLDQRDQRGSRFVQRGQEVGMDRALEDSSEAVDSAIPQLDEGFARARSRIGPARRQIVEVDQRASFEQGLHLVFATDDLPARQQQCSIGIANVERQRCTEGEPLPDAGKRTELHALDFGVSPAGEERLSTLLSLRPCYDSMVWAPSMTESLR